MKNLKPLAAALLAALVALPGVSSAQSGPSTVLTYDAAGHVTGVGLPGGRTRYLQYDLLGRNTAQSGSGASVGFGYDGQDRLTGVVDPRGLGTSYSRNGLGQVASQSSPDTGASSFTYDGNGNVTQRVNAAGQVEAYTYDAADRVTSKTLSYPTGGSISYTFGYGSGATAGRVTSVSGPGVTLGYGYNLFGEVTATSQAVTGSPTLSASYGYAANGALTSITYPSGRVVSFGLDGASRPASVSVGGSNLLTGIGYSPLGGLAGWTFGNGQGVSRTYDTNGRLTSVTLPTGQRSYSYDADDRIVGISDALLGNATYGYDDLDHLTSATTSQGSWSYAYDANGNRTQGYGASTSIDGGSNRMLAYSAPAFGTSVVTQRQSAFTADGQTSQVTGNAPSISCGSTVNLGYTADGQLVTSTGLSATYGPTGLRLQKRAAACAGGAVANFVYDPAGHLLGEYDATGVPIQETVWVGDTPAVVFKSDGQAVQTYYVYADNLNTPRGITNAAGALVWSWDGEPFGASAPNENPSNLSAFKYGLRFPGQYFDVETGYHQNRWREYDPAAGRYVQSDPIGLAGGSNTYVYVGANPLGFSDPQGLCPFCLIPLAAAEASEAWTAGTVLLLRYAPQLNAFGIAIAEAWGGASAYPGAPLAAAVGRAAPGAIRSVGGAVCSIAEHGLAAEKGFPGIGVTARGGPTLSGTPYLYPAGEGQQNIVNLVLTGSRRADFAAANEAAGLAGVVPKGKESPAGYVWHHADDYDPISGAATLELGSTGAHRATYPHSGSVSQYEQATGIPYKR
jgi:RHS repeat-associated protein